MKTDSPRSTPTVFASLSDADSLPDIAAQQLTGARTTVAVPDSSIAPAPSPAVVGKYVLLEEGKAGGMGIVYKACDVELDRIVALKMIKGGILATDEEIARFHREARAAARLNHPNIIDVHEIGQEHGCPYFTMDFAPGGSLAEQRERFADPRTAASLLETLARAVHHAHQRGILHRDLKPANILFDESGAPLVSDFGLAKFIDASLELTQTGAVLGTPSYMAPEQASGHTDQISAATDVWALGVILYELLTGQQPFKGGSHEERLRKVQTTEPPLPRSIQRGLDRSLETVVLKCLEKEPSRRYASAEALADDLARWLRGEPVTARPPSRWIRAWRAVRRYRTAAVRVVLAVIFFVLVILVWRSFSPSVPPSEAGDRPTPEEKTILLGASGPPSWYRWSLFPQQGTGIELDNKRVFRVRADKLPGMLELLPSAPRRYRLRAQVQHISSQSQHGKAGIYFAHGKHLTKEGTAHCFFRVAFNDRVPTLTQGEERTPPASQVQMMLSIFRENKDKKDAFFRRKDISCALAQQFTPAGEVEPMPWRTLEVEVTPDRIKAAWEDRRIETIWWKEKVTDGVDPKKVLESVSIYPLLGLPIDATELPLGEGIGLYVEIGVAAFRSVVIEPLPQQ